MDIEAMLALPAGRELDRALAEMLGWTVMSHEGIYVLVTPGDRTWQGGLESEDEAWGFVPHYSTDANAALSLPIHNLQMLEINVCPAVMKTIARIEEAPISSRSRMNLVWQSSDTPALAIVRAWLAHQHAMKRGG